MLPWVFTKEVLSKRNLWWLISFVKNILPVLTRPLNNSRIHTVNLFLLKAFHCVSLQPIFLPNLKSKIFSWMVLFIFSLILNAYQQTESSYKPRRQNLLTLVTYLESYKEEGRKPYSTGIDWYLLPVWLFGTDESVHFPQRDWCV